MTTIRDGVRPGGVGRWLAPLGLALMLGGGAAMASESPLRASDLPIPLSPAAVHVAQADTAADDAIWALVRDSGDPGVLSRFIEQYPDSPHVPEARAKLAALNDQGGIIEAPVSEPPTPLPEAPDDQTLALDVQTELQRLGCYKGTLDGNWGPGSRKALADFATRTGFDMGSQGPNEALLQMLKLKRGAVCVAEASSAASHVQTGAFSKCYDVFVAVDALDSLGGRWDLVGGTVGNPDPKITEATTGATNECDDSFTCSLRVSPAGRTMSFAILDMDFNAPDPIGSGTCTSGKSCRLGSATLTMKAC